MSKDQLNRTSEERKKFNVYKNKIGLSIEEAIVRQRYQISSPVHNFPAIGLKKVKSSMAKTKKFREAISAGSYDNSNKSHLPLLWSDIEGGLPQRAKTTIDYRPSTETSDYFPSHSELRSAEMPTTPIDLSLEMSVDRIYSKVINLKYIYDGSDPMNVRTVAATIISANVRGFLSRLRYKRYALSRKKFKISRCREITVLLDDVIASRKSIMLNLQRFKRSQDMKNLKRAFGGWNDISKESAPRRRGNLLGALAILCRKNNRILSTFFLALKECTSQRMSRYATNSRSNATKTRKMLLDSLRAELSLRQTEKGFTGVVLKEDLMRRYYAHVVNTKIAERRSYVLNSAFSRFLNIVKKLRDDEIKSHRHWLKQSAGKCFEAWMIHTHDVYVGVNHKRWRGLKSYEIRYNQRKVDSFGLRRLLRFAFYPWRERHLVMIMVKRKRRCHIYRFLRRVFLSIAQVTKNLRGLRRSAIKSWKDYPLIITSKPFTSWRNFAKAAKMRQAEETRMMSAYVRWKWRQKLLLIVRIWRHQALFGRIDGMYTRKMLLSSLADQKRATVTVERMLSDRTVELENCDNLLRNSVALAQELEQQLSEARSETSKQAMVLHHAHSEILRLQSLVDAMAIVNPRHIAHLEELQIALNFKDRGALMSESENGKLEHISKQVLKTRSNANIPCESKQSNEERKDEMSEEKNPRGSLGVDVMDPLAFSRSSIDASNDGTGMHGRAVSSSDRLLLDRAVWLIERFCSKEAIEFGGADRYNASDKYETDSRSCAERSRGTADDVKDSLSADKLSFLLVGIVDFLANGDPSRLPGADRRAWISHIVNSTSNDFVKPENGLSESSSTASVVDMLMGERGLHSWRDAVVALRTMTPQAPSSLPCTTGESSPGRPSSSSTRSLFLGGDSGYENGLFPRILDMRERIGEVMQRLEKKQLLVSSDAKDSNPVLHVYANNLANIISS